MFSFTTARFRKRGYRTLREGEQVEFDVKTGPRGPQAENVVRIEQEESGCRLAEDSG